MFFYCICCQISRFGTTQFRFLYQVISIMLLSSVFRQLRYLKGLSSAQSDLTVFSSKSFTFFFSSHCFSHICLYRLSMFDFIITHSLFNFLWVIRAPFPFAKKMVVKQLREAITGECFEAQNPILTPNLSFTFQILIHLLCSWHFVFNIFSNRFYTYENEHHHSILHIRFSLSIKFHFE